jgi:tetratricopeptide (TPR) repeat protein
MPVGRNMKKQAKRKPAAVAVKSLKRKKLKLVSDRGRRNGGSARTRPTSQGTVSKPAIDSRLARVVEKYEAAVRLLQEQKFERAKLLFEKVMAAAPPELADRARVHWNTCKQRLERHVAPIRTPEDHYNIAVALINSGKLEDAEQHLNRALKLTPRADHAYYALAAVQSLKGDIEGALENLKTAIDLEPRNRYLARNDRDFTALTEDPRFAELAYPDKNGA